MTYFCIEQKKFDVMWEQDAMRKLQREKEEAEKRKQADLNTINFLNEQLSTVAIRKFHEEEQQIKEGKAMKEKFEREKQELEIKEQKERELQRIRREELDRVNDLKKKQKEEQILKQKEMDMKLLQAALEKDRQAKAEELAAKVRH
jgi:hypothetical protein